VACRPELRRGKFMLLENLDTETLDWIKRDDVEPPPDLQSALTDADWWNLVIYYADGHGEGETRGSARLLATYYRGTEVDPARLWEMFGWGGSVDDVKWSEPHLTRLTEIFDRDDEDAGDDPDDAFTDWLEHAETMGGSLYEAFLGEITRIKHGSLATFSLDQIDWDYVLRLNEYLLKEAEPGDTIEFFQMGDQVMFVDPDQTPSSYWEAFEQAGAQPGSITVKSRGNLATRVRSGHLTSPGKIKVDGSPDEDAFEAHIRQFSKKEIEFG
jgi:hypothetical protein